jgi:membrane-bound ClpP family serine protease
MSKKIKSEDNKIEFALGKENYKLLAIGFAVIIIGFLLMIGGKAENPHVFSDKIFSFRRITLAPIIVLIGFIFEIYAIMKKPKSE